MFYTKGRKFRHVFQNFHQNHGAYRGTPSVTAAPCHRSTVRHSQSAPSHRAAFSGPVFRGCALRFAPCARHFSPSGLRCSQAHSRLSLPYWAYYGLFPPLAAAFVRPLLKPTGAATPRHRSTVQHGRLASCAKRTCDVPCFTGLTTACFRHWRRPSCAPFESLRRGYAAPPPF